jgi:hypothetical protein
MSEHYTTGRRYSYISNAWILDSSWNDKEEIAFLRAELDSRKPAVCEDCPPTDYPTNETRCAPCPRRKPEPGQPAAVQKRGAKFPLQKDLLNIRALIISDELSIEQALWMLDELVALRSNIAQPAAGQSEPVAEEDK